MLLLEQFELDRRIQLVRYRLIADEAPIAHNKRPPTIPRDVQLMSDHDNGHAALVELLKNAHDLDARYAVQIPRGLVRQKKRGPIDQRPRYRNTLLLAPR